MAQPKIFVSHSHVDDAFAQRLVKDLNAAGADAWLDKNDLGSGNFQQRISEALGKCDWFVLVLTRDALSSPWVVQEVDAANRLKHQGRIHDLIFIQAEPIEHRELPPLWGVYNIFDATADYAAARDRALQAVGIGAQGAPAPREINVHSTVANLVANLLESAVVSDERTDIGSQSGGALITHYRKLLPMTLFRLASLSQLDPLYVLRLEEGKVNPSQKTLAKISDVLKLSMDDRAALFAAFQRDSQ